jgi:ketosteroid isomerase-like protein
MRAALRTICASAFLLFVSAMSIADDGASFDEVLARHLAAIEQRDLPTLLDTVSDRPDFSVIFPNGSRIVGKAAFEAMHTEWFADPNWRIEFSQISRWESDGLAGALVMHELRDLPEPGTGNPRQTYLVLIFERVDGRWLLIHDQNTRVTEPASGD